MALMSATLIIAPSAVGSEQSQRRNSGGGNHRTTTTTTSRGNNRTSSRQDAASKSNISNRNTNSVSARPASGNSGSRPGNSGSRPNSGNSGSRPGNGNNNNRPGSGNHGNNNNRPGSGNHGNNNNRPGSGNHGGNNNRPGSGNHGNNNNRPGSGNHGGNNYRPGGNHGGGHGYHPGGGPHYGSSAPRPGAGSRPRPIYRPPVSYRWERPLPPPPPRYRTVRVGVPTIGSVLGLTFGTLIDYGVATLINAGYNVTSTYGGNTIYLTNVNQYGINWPQATIFYGNGGMSGARFQIASYSPTDLNFRLAYQQLSSIYGNPVSYDSNGGFPIVTWWGGNNTGYITLQYGPGVTSTGGQMYYTDLIYGM